MTKEKKLIVTKEHFEKAKHNTKNKRYCASKNCILAEAFKDNFPQYKFHGVSYYIRANNPEGESILFAPVKENKQRTLYDQLIGDFDEGNWNNIETILQKEPVILNLEEHGLEDWFKLGATQWGP